ncbi:hypothetical protein BCV70DRAFT_201410 [Testicularia cyperi]|uniref:Uncharacterized protein n=1 Tax=Testicularia cyperi TaxID=1882483 RepID=A0A317XP81_9BASI|nr:hypothetical protein BCV70DRAFT_201410 [Testicularia cyperi]
MASGYLRQELAPSGCSHAVLLHLHYHSPPPSRSQSRFRHRGKLVSQLVTARDDVLRIYDIYHNPPHASSSSSSSSTAASFSASASSSSSAGSSHRIVLAKEHSIFGTVTGLQRIQTLASDKDGRDRLLVSFADAKLALLEWCDPLDDLETVSIHTYERAPQLFNGTPHLFQPILNVDPLSRCAALLLPHDALAILPFYRDAADFDLDQGFHQASAPQDASHPDSWPYSPSFVLPMLEVDPSIRNLRDFCFLPGFQKPTVAVLFADPPTWTGLLGTRRDNCSVYIFTLDLSASLDGPLPVTAPTGTAASSGLNAMYDDVAFRSAHPVVTTSSQLPYDCLYVVPCPSALGGVLVVTMSAILHIDQSGRTVITALNDWFASVSSHDPESTLNLDAITDLQNSQLVFTRDTEGLLTLANGDFYTFRCKMDGRSVEGIRLERAQSASSLPAHREQQRPPQAADISVDPTATATISMATGPPSARLMMLHDSPRYLFSACQVGSSVLYELQEVKRTITPHASGSNADSSGIDGADGEGTGTGAAAAAAAAKNDEMELDLDDDLYGNSTGPAGANSGPNGSGNQETILVLSKADEIRSHGNLLSLARRKLPGSESESGSVSGSASSQHHALVACAGSGNQAGLVYFDPRLRPFRRCRLWPDKDQDHGDQDGNGNGDDDTPSAPQNQNISNVFTVGAGQDGSVQLLCSTHSDEESGTTLAVSYSAQRRSFQRVHQLPGRTLAAAALVGGRIGRVTSGTVQLLSDSFEVVSEEKLEASTSSSSSSATMAGPGGNSEILEARIEADEYAVVCTSDGETRVYRFDAGQGRIESVDLATVEGLGQILSLHVIRDVYGYLESADAKSNASSNSHPERAFVGAVAGTEEEEVDYGDDADDDAMLDSSNPNGNANTNKAASGFSSISAPDSPAYIIAADIEGNLQILRLPDLVCVWQNKSLAAQPQRLICETSRPGKLAPEQLATIVDVSACHLGDSLCLVSLTEDNFLTVYQASSFFQSQGDGGEGSRSRSGLRLEAESLAFNKVFVEVLFQPVGARGFDPNGGTGSSSYGGRRLRNSEVRFHTWTLPGCSPGRGIIGHHHHHDALLISGAGREASVSVLYRAGQGGVRLLDWADGDVTCVATLPPQHSNDNGDGDEDELIYTDTQGALWTATLPASLHDAAAWTSETIRTGREYTHVVAHDPTQSVVAASVNMCPFILFDDEGEAIRAPEEDVTPTRSSRGALELFIDQDRKSAIDGYEFEANETVTALEIVHLDAPSTVTGRKAFVAAGTTTYHGEDRTSKGTVYLFEVIQVVSGRYQVGNDLRLKLICRDDSRGPVTAIADLNGLLINTAGQKLYVRALEKEEWLISVAFLDCPFYITRVRVVKNFVLLSDVKKSLWLLALQEEPFRFVTLGRDIVDQHVALGEFLVHGDKVALVAASGERVGGNQGTTGPPGVVRLFEYAPSNPGSNGGQRLLLRTEFQTTGQAVDCTSCPGRWLSDSELRGREESRNRLLLAKSNGSLDSLCSVDDKVLHRLHLLQGQLIRSVQHTAALNPRAFRMVRNDLSSRPLTKGILDARLLHHFLTLPRPKMLEATKTLQNLFDGLDSVKPPPPPPTSPSNNKNDNDNDNDDNTKTDTAHDDDQDQTPDSLLLLDQTRRRSELKRVHLLVKDLVRLRVGFECV